MKNNGFTLVELAISLMIIGLLLGGVLKGEELLKNAQATAMVKAAKEYSVAMRNFATTYGALPGDISNASTRLPNCSTSPCNTNGNGDHLIGRDVGSSRTTWYVSIPFTDTEETSTFWRHLVAVEYIQDNWQDKFTQYALKSPFGATTILFPYSVDYAAPRSYGHFLFLLQPTQATLNVGSLSPDQNYALTPTVAFMLDSKMDDGRPMTGDVLVSSINSTACYSSGLYLLSGTGRACTMMMKIGDITSQYN